MRDIAIFGAGGLGKEVACLINRINSAYDDAKDRWQLIGFFDNEVKKGTQISHFGKVLGGMDELNRWEPLWHLPLLSEHHSQGSQYINR